MLSPLFVAGFYYKTFMWPPSWWEKLYEPAIRHAAGLGRASIESDPDDYDKAHAFCDVLVIGAGPAGLCAALTAGRAGARVMLCDEDFLLGGRLNGDRREIDGMPGAAWANRVEAELAALPDVTVMRRTTVFGAYDGRTYGAVERIADHLPVPGRGQARQRLWKIVAKRTILAAGAIERPIVFGGNDRPGVMMASAVRTYVNRFGVAPGRRVVLFTVNRRRMEDGARSPRCRHHGRGHRRRASRGRAGRGCIGTACRRAHHAGRPGEGCARAARGRCDHGARSRWTCVTTAGGYPRRFRRLEPDPRARHPPRRTAPLVRGASPPSCPVTCPRGMTAVGAAAGSMALAAALREGASAGEDAARAAGFHVAGTAPPRADDESTRLAPLWHVVEAQDKAFVDFQHDVTVGDVALAAREGFRAVEHLKRYTTLGMATDQGKTSNVNGYAIMAALTGRTIPEVGTTVFRPPYTPVAIGALAGRHRGRHFRPTRLTSGHPWAAAQGATFVRWASGCGRNGSRPPASRTGPNGSLAKCAPCARP